MTIGYKIKKIRELKNFTQDDIAEKLSMSLTGYGKIERDEVDLPFSRLEQISKVLDVKVEDIVSFNEKCIFNNYGSAHDKSFSVINEYSSKTEKLYEDKIKLLEEKIVLLEELHRKK